MSPHVAATIDRSEQLIRECQAMCRESARICEASTAIVVNSRRLLGLPLEEEGLIDQTDGLWREEL